MKRIILLVALFAVACGGDSGIAPSKDNNASTNGTSNNHSNTDGSTNTTSGTHGESNTTGVSNNGESNSNGATNTTGDTTTLPPGTIRVQSTISPNQGPVGTTVTHTFTLLSNFELDPNIGGDHVVGFGHFHVYLDVVDDDHELLESATNPDTFVVDLPGETLAPGAHALIIKVHKNDHSEYSTPLQYQIGFTVTE